jgi:hypothetical protein
VGAEVYQVDPLGDPRWPQFVARHPLSSLYHTQPWLEALKRTYGYQPVAYTTSPPGSELSNGLLFCRTESWLTGRRIVAALLSDYCDPLAASEDDFAKLIRILLPVFQKEKWNYIELRPRRTIAQVPPGFQPYK